MLHSILVVFMFLLIIWPIIMLWKYKRIKISVAIEFAGMIFMFIALLFTAYTTSQSYESQISTNAFELNNNGMEMSKWIASEKDTIEKLSNWTIWDGCPSWDIESFKERAFLDAVLMHMDSAITMDLPKDNKAFWKAFVHNRMHEFPVLAIVVCLNQSEWSPGLYNIAYYYALDKITMDILFRPCLALYNVFIYAVKLRKPNTCSQCLLRD